MLPALKDTLMAELIHLTLLTVYCSSDSLIAVIAIDVQPSVTKAEVPCMTTDACDLSECDGHPFTSTVRQYQSQSQRRRFREGVRHVDVQGVSQES